MEKFQLFREEALKNYRLADHLLNVTYPLIKDTKLLLSTADCLFLALTSTVSSLLHHEMLFKAIPPFEENFESRFHLLRHHCAPRHQIKPEYLNLISELREIILLHKSGPVEFRHKDRFVICTKDYRIRAITANQLKVYLRKTREFLELVSQITSPHERIFKSSRNSG